MNRLETPPLDDQFEVSVFGPGIGESLALHLGFGEWMIVDSCQDPKTREPAALQYLDRLGVDASRAVKLLVLTHWHDDHIRGAATIFQRTESAQLACSAKDHGEAFFQAVETARAARLKETGFDEMSELLRILIERRASGQRLESVGPIWAAEGMTLLRREGSGLRHPVQVVALSPSHATLTLALHELRGFLPRPNGPERRAVRLTPNQRSVALLVQAGSRAALLGGDLEESSNPAVGWRAVVNSSVRPQQQCGIFKVPHHGSQNADNVDVWHKMLGVEPVACLTPFSKGRSPLPTAQDLRRLAQRTTHLYCTRPARGPRPRRRISAVERTMRQVARRRRTMEGPLGQIRVRGSVIDASSDLTIDLLGPAFQA